MHTIARITWVFEMANTGACLHSAADVDPYVCVNRTSITDVLTSSVHEFLYGTQTPHSCENEEVVHCVLVATRVVYTLGI